MIVIKNVFGGSKVYIKNVFANAENIVVVYNGGEPIEITGGGGGSGDVVGPSSATDNAVVRFDGTTGKLVKNSGVTIDDSGNLTANNISGTNTGDQDLSGYYTEGEVDTLLSGKANTSHTHSISDVTGLQTALDGKADTSHTHVISDVTNLQTELDYLDSSVAILNALGAGIIAESYGVPRVLGSVALSFVDGTALFIAVVIHKSATVTGVGWIQTTAGNYTADNFNGVGLYTYSGGTLTQVAVSVNDGNIWKQTSNTVGRKAFSSPYAASPGVYFIGALYNSSAQTTAPSIAGSPNHISVAGMINDLTNSAKITGARTAQTTLLSSESMTNLSGSQQHRYFFLY